jgi:CheY-like chemotaxis protein
MTFSIPNEELRIQKGIPHVLVVDDTEVIRLVLHDMLVTLGCTVEAFNSGEAVLEHIASGAAFDFILMDCQMPQMDGLETTRRLLRDHPERNIKVVAISAHGTESDRIQQRGAGMVEHLNKPFRLKDLQALLNQMA